MGQREALAYGEAIYGGVVIGGNNAGKYPLGKWQLADDTETRQVSADFSLIHSTNALLGTRFDALRAALEKASGNLAITVGVDRTITCTVSNAAQIVTLTKSAGDSFTATDVGLPVQLGTDVSIQITGFISASVVSCVLAPGIALPATGVGVSCVIGEVLVRCAERDDQGVDLIVGGIHARTSVDRPADVSDSEEQRSFEFSAVFERPAAETRVDNTTRPHVRRSSVSRVVTDSGLMGLAFTGEVTAGVIAGDGTRAFAILSTAIDTWISGQLTALGPGRSFELIQGTNDVADDEDAVLTFSRVYKENFFPDLKGVINDPRITGAQVTFTRQYQNVHGIKAARQPFYVNVNWSAAITAVGTNAVTLAELHSFWGKTIKPYLLDRVKALFGGTMVVVAGSDPSYDAVNSKASSSFVVFVSDSGSNVFQYSRTSEMSLDERLDIDDIWDGNDHSYVLWSPGKTLTGSVTVQVIQIGEPTRLRRTNEGGGQNSLATFPGGGIFFAGGDAVGGAKSLPLGVFEIKGTGSNGNAAGTSPNSYKTFPDPGLPERFFGKPEGSKWTLLRRQARETPTFWGEDPDNVGNRVQVTTTTYTGAYLRVSKKEYDPATVRPSTNTGGQAANQSQGGGKESKPEAESQ